MLIRSSLHSSLLSPSQPHPLFTRPLSPTLTLFFTTSPFHFQPFPHVPLYAQYLTLSVSFYTRRTFFAFLALTFFFFYDYFLYATHAPYTSQMNSFYTWASLACIVAVLLSFQELTHWAVCVLESDRVWVLMFVFSHWAVTLVKVEMPQNTPSVGEPQILLSTEFTQQEHMKLINPQGQEFTRSSVLY